MSTPDQPGGQLTRKQLREARLTGSTPIVTPEEAEAARQKAAAAQIAAAEAAETAAVVVSEETSSAAAPIIEEPAAPVSAPVEPLIEEEPAARAAEPPTPADGDEPLTRRQMREQERVRTGALPIADPSSQSAPSYAGDEQSGSGIPAAVSPPLFGAAVVGAPTPAVAPAVATAPEPSATNTDASRLRFPSRRRSFAPAVTAAPSNVSDEQDGVDDAEQDVAPVSVSSLTRADGAVGAWQTEPVSVEQDATDADRSAPDVTPATDADLMAGPLRFGAEQTGLWSATSTEAAAPSGHGPAPVQDAAGTAAATVNPGFGERVLEEQAPRPQADSFDALVGDSTGSHHAAPNALIFQQAPVAPSLSGPVAATGEILVTGSYELPSGFGSRGHADGVADGKEVDAVLVDGELAPASSPTPIAASAAIGTIKPAGEVIRPPEPEKGNKLMLALTITAGALAVALVGALIVAITTGAFS